MGGLLVSLPLYNKDTKFWLNSLIFYHLFSNILKDFLLIINPLYIHFSYICNRLRINQLAGRILLSTPALPPYKDTKKIPYNQGMWITFYLAIPAFFRTFARLVRTTTFYFYSITHRIIQTDFLTRMKKFLSVRRTV